MAAEGRAAAQLQPAGEGSGEPEGGFGQLLEEDEEGEDAGYVLYRYGRGGAAPERPGRGSLCREGGGGAEPRVASRVGERGARGGGAIPVSTFLPAGGRQRVGLYR